MWINFGHDYKIVLKRQYLFYDSGILYCQGPISKKQIEIIQIKSI